MAPAYAYSLIVPARPPACPQAELAKFRAPEQAEVFFSAHGVPQSYVDDGEVAGGSRSTAPAAAGKGGKEEE